MTEKEENYETFCETNIERFDPLVIVGPGECPNGCAVHAFRRRAREPEPVTGHWSEPFRSYFAIHCTTSDCGKCDRKICKAKAASKDVFEGVCINVSSEGLKTDPRSLGPALPRRSPAAGFKVSGEKWVLSGSRSWDYGSKLGRSFSEVGVIL